MRPVQFWRCDGELGVGSVLPGWMWVMILVSAVLEHKADIYPSLDCEVGRVGVGSRIQERLSNRPYVILHCPGTNYAVAWVDGSGAVLLGEGIEDGAGS